MVATFDDTALVDDDDLVGHAYGRESMRNDDGDAVLHQRAEVREDFGFGGGVHRCGRLIQHEDVGLTTHERAGQRDLLPLAAGQFAAIAEPLSELCLVAASSEERRVGKECGSTCRSRWSLHL